MKFRQTSFDSEANQNPFDLAELCRGLINLNSEVGEAIVMLQDIGAMEGIQVFVTDQWSRITGYSRNELIGKSFFDYIQPTDREASLGRHRQKLTGKQITGLFEMTVICRDGSKIPIEVTGTRTQYQNKAANVVYIRDITERKKAEAALIESEERFRAVFECANDAIHLMDGERFIECNARAVEMYGCIDKADMVNHKPSDFSPLKQPDGSDSREQAQKYIEAALDGVPQRFYWQHLKKNRVLFDVDVSLNRVVLNGRQYLQAIGRDITERKKAEEERRRLISIAEASNRMAALGEMAAGIAHEINNPLTSISTFSQLMLDRKDLPADVRGWANVMLESSKRTTDIIKRLLIYSRQNTHNPNPTDINELIVNTIKMRSFYLKTNKVVVSTSFEDHLPLLSVDDGQLQQVLLNLLANAEYAIITSEHEGKIKITTKKQKDKILILIQDNGVGIPPQHLPHIFEPFFSTKPHGQGTGLGLSISHSILKAHGGEITVTSEPGKGAVFIITLPVTGCSNID